MISKFPASATEEWREKSVHREHFTPQGWERPEAGAPSCPVFRGHWTEHPAKGGQERAAGQVGGEQCWLWAKEKVIRAGSVHMECH